MNDSHCSGKMIVPTQCPENLHRCTGSILSALHDHRHLRTCMPVSVTDYGINIYQQPSLVHSSLILQNMTWN